MTDTHEIVPRADVSSPRTIMHPLVEAMLATSPTPEALEKILSLQRQWEKDEARRAYSTALVELKRALPPFLSRDKTVDFTGSTGKRTTYTHTSLAGAMETVQPHLTEFGFSLTWRPGTNEKGGVTVTAILTHRQGHSEEATLTAPPDTTGNKSSAQAIASTITLLQRYSALAILGLATADMVEPTGQAPSDENGVDTARNMKAMSAIAKAGKSKAEAEKFAGKPLQQWTPKELDKLRAWIAPPAAAPENATPEEWTGAILGVLVVKAGGFRILGKGGMNFETTDEAIARKAKTSKDTGELVVIRHKPGKTAPEALSLQAADQPPE